MLGDYTTDLTLPDCPNPVTRRVVYFPGSTIGNFDVAARLALLHRMARLCGIPGGQLLIGIDLVKDIARLENAYDDAEGVTAAFNRNLLHRINRELDSDFVPDRFSHHARFNEDQSRIEMHLVSDIDQVVRINGQSFQFQGDESICTEHSYKFTIDGFGAQSAEAGWTLEQSWTDRDDLFAILLLRTT